MKKIHVLFLMLIIFNVSVFSQGQIQSILKDTVRLEEIVVTGTTVKVNRNNVPMAVSVVGTRQLTESVETALFLY
jgi:iron complex outermembrane receptor protein